jgi:hypothetical protein
MDNEIVKTILAAVLDQISKLVLNLSDKFASTVELLVNKFEAFNHDKLDNYQNQIYNLSTQIEKIEEQNLLIVKANNDLKHLLSNNYLNSIKNEDKSLPITSESQAW